MSCYRSLGATVLCFAVEGLNIRSYVSESVPKDSLYSNLALCSLGMYALLAGRGLYKVYKKRKMAKELDVLQYIKTGDPGTVAYKDTPVKALASGLTLSCNY